MRKLTVMVLLLLVATPLLAQKRPRARDLGIPFDGFPGKDNALTDVPGVEVGMVTLIRDARRGPAGEPPRFAPALRRSFPAVEPPRGFRSSAAGSR